LRGSGAGRLATGFAATRQVSVALSEPGGRPSGLHRAPRRVRVALAAGGYRWDHWYLSFFLGTTRWARSRVLTWAHLPVRRHADPHARGGAIRAPLQCRVRLAVAGRPGRAKPCPAAPDRSSGFGTPTWPPPAKPACCPTYTSPILTIRCVRRSSE